MRINMKLGVSKARGQELTQASGAHDHWADQKPELTKKQKKKVKANQKKGRR
jgi:hypothetical protein